MMRDAVKRSVLCLVMAGSASQALALEPAGPEFQANTYTSCNQRNPDIAAYPDGGFVIVWASGSYYYPQDGSYPGVFGQRFNDTGARVGTEFQVNTYTTAEQRLTRIATQPDGRFVVVWQSWAQDGDLYGIFGRQFNTNATAAGTEFRINSTTLSGQYFPRIATHDQGFVVIWESYYKTLSGESVFGQRFDSNAGKLGTEFRVNNHTIGYQSYPEVAARDDGRFIVVWHSSPAGNEAAQDGSAHGVRARRYDAAGQPIGNEFAINTYTTGSQARPAVAYAPNGKFLVVWESPGLQGSVSDFDDAVGRMFGANGTPAGTEFRINGYTPGAQQDVVVRPSAGGDFLVSWESLSGIGATDTQSIGVFARRVSATGVPLGNEFQLNTYTVDDQTDPRIIGLANGGFAATWESDEQDGTLDGVFGQSYLAPETVCGDGSGDGNVTATDALLALSTAVGTASCPPCVCDVDSSGSTAASDALRILQNAVGVAVTLTCVAC